MLTLWQQSEGAFATDRPGLHHLVLPGRHRRRGRAARRGGLRATRRRRSPTTGVVAARRGRDLRRHLLRDPDGIRLEIYAPDRRRRLARAADHRRPDLRLLLGGSQGRPVSRLPVKGRSMAATTAARGRAGTCGLRDRQAGQARGAIGKTVPDVAAAFLAQQPMSGGGGRRTTGPDLGDPAHRRARLPGRPGPQILSIGALPPPATRWPGSCRPEAPVRARPVGMIAHRTGHPAPDAHERPGGPRLTGCASSSTRSSPTAPSTSRNGTTTARRPTGPRTVRRQHGAEPRAAADARGRRHLLPRHRLRPGRRRRLPPGRQPRLRTGALAHRLRWPDYAGNAMFLTLGNLELNPAAGLLVPGWKTGTSLHLTGSGPHGVGRGRGGPHPRGPAAGGVRDHRRTGSGVGLPAALVRARLLPLQPADSRLTHAPAPTRALPAPYP